jgi:hypothetical protein
LRFADSIEEHERKKHMKTITNVISPAFAVFAIACFALSPTVEAVSPPPDGGYPGANTAEGTNALFSLTGGIDNTALGFQALYYNTTGNYNTAEGFRALFRNTTGTQNTATGLSALTSNTTGHFNTATGVNTLYRNTTGFRNTATGVEALFNNTTGGNLNTANGVHALFSNTTGSDNTANGVGALRNNATGSFNTANGVTALFSNTTGSNNIALGWGAGGSVTTANNVIAIGNNGANVSNTCYISNIFGVTSSGGTGVFVNLAGKLGTTTSSRRFKDHIEPMDRASEALFALKPVTFLYKQEVDPAGIPQFGLVAEDVEKVNPDLVVRDAEGKVNTVRYEAVNAMLLNEFLKEHRTVQEQQKEINALRAELKEQRALIQKVSDKVELSRPAPQTVLNR